MPTPTQQVRLLRHLATVTRQLADYGIQLAPIAAFIFISCTPAHSLAFAQYIDIERQPLEFVRDPSLPEDSIIGIEAFPHARTAGQLLRSRSSRIPSATLYLAPGMAVRVLASAYSSTADQTDGNPFITASGSHVHPGTIAANFLPFGSQVRIGNNLYTVEDRLNARYNGKYIVDVWFPSRGEALQFGVRVVEIEIVSIAGR